MDDWAAFEAAAARPEPTVLRVRTGRIAPSDLQDRLTEQGFSLAPKDGLPGFYEVLDGPRAASATLEHWHGLFYVQQASTGVAAPLLGPRPGDRVLDLCSAPGGKTTHIAELMDDRGCLVASEISESRIRGLLGNVYRLGHTNILVVAGDGRDFPEGALFDRVLVDAPCSGEGTLRRRGGRAPRQSSSFAGYVAAAQRSLLEKAVRVTRPGGTVLYVTCTFAPEENEAVVHDALASLPVELEPLDLPVPCAPGITEWEGTSFDARLEGAARIYPHHFDSGGLFLARLRRLEGEMPPADGRASGAGSAWSSVATDFPGEERGEGDDQQMIADALADLSERFGVPADAWEGMGWIRRGGRLWLHSLDEWPLDGWLEKADGDPAWRPISVGFRAVDFDTRGRPRPSNDLLCWLDRHVSDRVFDIDDDGAGGLTRREPVHWVGDLRGPVALRHRGRVLGRGAATEEGLKGEIPKARLADLARGLPPEPISE